ncbi:MAG: peptidoglycan-binding protein, partial [Candidatus Kaiserbacteria bacterium]|nr:peptidoglycan-binding protein [Candidatus Kaiserbacteria bacterium]
VLPAGTAPSSAVESKPSSVSPSASLPQAAPAAPKNSITPSVPPSVKSSLPKYNFARPLKRGSKNSDVTSLQKFLAQYKDIYPDGYVTGYFGPATEKAVGLFQEKYGVAKRGEEGYGTVGPKTRAKLNSVQ